MRWWRVLLGALVCAVGVAVVYVLDVYAVPGSGNTAIAVVFGSSLLLGIAFLSGFALIDPPLWVRRRLALTLGWLPAAILLTTAVDVWLHWQHYRIQRSGGTDVVGARIFAAVLLLFGLGAAIAYAATVWQRLRPPAPEPTPPPKRRRKR